MKPRADVGAGCYTVTVTASLVIDVPDLAVSVDTERPIGGETRIRVYVGPDIELVFTPGTADRLADALVNMDEWPVISPQVTR
jgi:hypothetical protein